MPRLSVLAVRMSLSCLLIGATLGALLLAHKGVPIDASLWVLRGPHIELVLVGWLVQLALGVAFWILPRPRLAEERARRERTAWAAFAVLNAGLVTAVVASAVGAPAPMLGAGRALELLGVALFGVHAWSRVRGAAWRKHVREGG